MIKYAEIKGYKNLGEVAHHLYQWMEDTEEDMTVILVRAYDTESKVFKGKIYNSTDQYVSLPILENELDDVESIIGKCEVITDANVISEGFTDKKYKEKINE